MSFDMDDRRFTAYVLGEMDDEQRLAFEQEIEGNEAAAAELDELRSLSARLESELAAEAVPSLTEEQRDTIVAQDAALTTPRLWWVWKHMGWAAAAVVIGFSLVAQIMWASRDNDAADNYVDTTVATSDGDAVGTGGSGPERAIESSLSKVTEEDEAKRAFWESITATRKKDVNETVSRVVPTAKTELKLDPSNYTPPEASVGLVAGNKPVAGVAWNRSNSAPHGSFFYGRVSVPGTESYDAYKDNPFARTIDEHTSTFSIDVDTASYANVRRFLVQNNRLPPPQAVRVEELINYFKYDYKAPADDAKHPFAAHIQVAACPWNPTHRLARIALKGKTMETHERPSANLVFLVDVSGSMRDTNKLPLAVKGLKMMLESLDGDDRVGIVTYAGQAQVALASTSAGEYDAVAQVIDTLSAGGSTNGGSGIQMAYEQAQKHFIKGGVNRVVLLTDGDFNVGISDRAGLVSLIEEKAKSKVFLSVVGFGQGNYKDAQMEELSNKGNGNYAYVDGEKEARKVFVDELTGNLVTIAKDVKIQVQFNPKQVVGYRLVGYENRRLAARDFNDDRKDAGEIGAGHTVTALYELVPAGIHLPGPRVDPNPFVDPAEKDEPKKDEARPPMADSKALFKLRVRYKQPEGLRSVLMEQFAMDEGLSFEKADDDFQWAAAAAGFGMLLRGSPHLGQTNYDAVLEIAKPLVGEDEASLRREFLNVVTKAKSLAR